jgi:hypothetical protein
MTVPSEAAPADVAPSPPAQPIHAARKFTDLIEWRPFVVPPFWICAFFAVIWRAAHRPLWFDKLFTYYIAMSTTTFTR